MMGLAVVQRGMGFVRTALFCRLLPEQELGQWSLVFSFVMLMAPMTLMGITGSFGRYVEHYFQRGLARRFFQSTATAVAFLCAAALIAITCLQNEVAWLLFGSVSQKHLLVPACLTLITTIVYNYFLEAAIALRRARVGSVMELISSWTFALTAVASLLVTDWGAYGVVLGFAAGNLAGAAFSGWNLAKIWSKLPVSQETISAVRFWKKLAPFALGLWGVNIITNLLDISDRYMIIHFSGQTAGVAQGLVGQYFSSLAVPLLMVGISDTLAHLVMPYLSQDWEQRNFVAVSRRLNLSIKMVGLLLCVASTAVVAVAPLLFDLVFGGKYPAGFAVLPYTIAFCFWRALTSMGYNYLYCAEKTRWMCGSLVVALVTNVVLNAVLLPWLGLKGAALATAISSALNLSIILLMGVRLGFALDRGLWWVILFPAVLPLGIYGAMPAIFTLAFVTLRTEWFVSTAERESLDETLHDVLDRILPNRTQALLRLRSVATGHSS